MREQQQFKATLTEVPDPLGWGLFAHAVQLEDLRGDSSLSRYRLVIRLRTEATTDEAEELRRLLNRIAVCVNLR